MTNQARAERVDAGEQEVKSFSELLADQLGGVRGLVESSIPIVVFVALSTRWELRPTLIAALATALAIAVYRLARRQSVRYSINGVFGILIGVATAWKTGDAKDFYLPGILINIGYGVGGLASVAIGRPLVGWFWSVIMSGGSSEWRENPRLLRTFRWLTVLWASIYLAKAVIQASLYLADEVGALGVVRLAFGYPPYLMLLALTVWAVRRVTRNSEIATRHGPEPEPA